MMTEAEREWANEHIKKYMSRQSEIVATNKQVLVVTGTTDRWRGVLSGHGDPNDARMEEVFDLTLPSKQRYCKKHGYSLLSLRSFGSGKRHGWNDDDVAALRIAIPIDMLEYYDIIMWIDADSIITNDNMGISEFPLSSDPDDLFCFYASWDWPGPHSLSTGNFIIQQNRSLYDFIDFFTQIRGNFPNEQEAINSIFRDSGTLLHSGRIGGCNLVKALDYRFLGSVPSPTWSGGTPQNGSQWTKDSFLAHCTYGTNKQRIEIINSQFVEYL